MVRVNVKTTIALHSLMSCFANMEDVHNKEEYLIAGQILLKRYNVALTEKEVRETKKIFKTYFSYQMDNPCETIIKIINENEDIEKHYKDKYFAAFLYIDYLDSKCTSFLKKDDKEYKMVKDFIMKLIFSIFY